MNAPLFRHEGLHVTETWSEVDLAKLPKATRKALVDYTGQLVRLHPDDLGELAKAGLEAYLDQRGFQRLREVAPKKG